MRCCLAWVALSCCWQTLPAHHQQAASAELSPNLAGTLLRGMEPLLTRHAQSPLTGCQSGAQSQPGWHAAACNGAVAGKPHPLIIDRPPGMGLVTALLVRCCLSCSFWWQDTSTYH